MKRLLNSALIVSFIGLVAYIVYKFLDASCAYDIAAMQRGNAYDDDDDYDDFGEIIDLDLFEEE